MSDERRYTDEEVRQIFDLATRRDGPGARTPSSAEGLTLPELKEIGREVGVAPERVADAAGALDLHGGASPRGSQLGLPVSVGRAVELPRPPTDGEWEVLVAECRRTFGARGSLSAHGRSREWRNGNLHVAVEPTGDGHRLRMGTRMGNATALNVGGALGVATAAIMLVVVLLSGQPASELVAPAVLFLMGGGALASNAVRLPRWAREREEQMAYLAERARSLLRAEDDPDEEG